MKSSIFTRMVLALLLLLTPIIALYAYSNHTSSSVLKREIVKAKRTQVETFVGQLGQMFAQYDSYQKMLYESTEVRNLAYPDLLNDDLLYYRTLKTVSEEISRLAGYGRWKGIIAVVYPKTGVVIKSNSSLGAVPAELPDKDGFWSYRTGPKGNAYFIETISNPAKSAREEEADLTVVAKVDEGEIKSDLSEMKSNGLEDPFLYKPGGQPDLQLYGESGFDPGAAARAGSGRRGRGLRAAAYPDERGHVPGAYGHGAAAGLVPGGLRADRHNHGADQAQPDDVLLDQRHDAFYGVHPELFAVPEHPDSVPQADAGHELHREGHLYEPDEGPSEGGSSATSIRSSTRWPQESRS
ncbi:hypothetical protein [Cohnella rhizosphaerae]|uniref:Cache domain-containing protein n=1 Tax=Cohnella rhizosphaerae TaxID=1457232 RepID=A0A9X4L5N6_9BACL|nr:hypothetical protein [Cohnella rhizosphaerae]MDG0813937.1 hypothetical protein [Cohnella rhizosphaerae]